MEQRREFISELLSEILKWCLVSWFSYNISNYWCKFSFSGKESTGPVGIFKALSNIRITLAGEWPPEKLVHIVEKLQCRAHGQDGVAIRVSGSFIVGNQFLICGDGIQVEGVPNFKDLSIDIPSKRMGTFQEQFIMEAGSIGRYFIAKQELYIIQ